MKARSFFLLDGLSSVKRKSRSALALLVFPRSARACG